MSEIARRAFAGIWFALAALIPVAYYFLRNPFDKGGLPILGGSVVFTVAVPIFISGVCGLSLGADIVNPEETKTVFQAVGRGLAVGLLSYFLLFSCSVFIVAFISQDIVGVIIIFGFLFFYGLLFIGWLVVLIGAAAGGLLYFFRLKMVEREKFSGILK